MLMKNDKDHPNPQEVGYISSNTHSTLWCTSCPHFCICSNFNKICISFQEKNKSIIPIAYPRHYVFCSKSVNISDHSSQLKINNTHSLPSPFLFSVLNQ